MQHSTPLPATKAATISTRPKPKSQLAGGGQVSLRSPPHLTTTPATAGEEALTSGREESGSESHHSIKEWQAGGGQAALQEQPPDSRSPLHGMTAPGVNLHKEPEEKVEGFEEAEDNVQSVSSKVAAREKVQEEDMQLNQEHDEEQNMSKEKHGEAEKGKTLEELGEKEEEEVDPDDVGIQAKSEQGGSLQNQSGHDGDPPGQDGDPPVQPDQDLHLHHPGLKELEEHVTETEKEEIEEVKVIEEQLLNTDTKAEKTEKQNVEERPHEHSPDHLSGSVDLVGEGSGLELHQNKKEISFTPALDASQSPNPDELLIGDSPSRSPGNYAENGVGGESKAAVSQTDEVGRDEEGAVDGEEAFEKENISEELFGASESHDNSGELKKNKNVPVVENPDKTVVTEWEWGRDVNEVEAPVAPLVDGNKKEKMEQVEKVDMKDSPVGKEDPLVTLMEVEEHSMQLLLTPKSWQPQASVSR